MFGIKSSSRKSVESFLKFYDEWEEFLDNSVEIMEEYKKNGGKNLLEVHEVFEKLTKLKIECEKTIYGIVFLRTSHLSLFVTLKNPDITAEEKAEFSYIYYFLHKMKNKYDKKTLNESVKFAKKAQDAFGLKDLIFYINLYKSIEILELRFKERIFLNF